MIDNLPAYKADRLREAIKACGRTFRDLPKYSPDLNAIALSIGKVETDLCKRAERTIPRLRRPIGCFAETLTAREASICLRHAG